MAKKHRQPDEDARRNAKRVCRLNRRQVKMARALGMNPKKLPGLRPSPQQRWKLPVGEFIEECYWKRFGGSLWDDDPREPKPGSRNPSTNPVTLVLTSARRVLPRTAPLVCSATGRSGGSGGHSRVSQDRAGARSWPTQLRLPKAPADPRSRAGPVVATSTKCPAE